MGPAAPAARSPPRCRAPGRDGYGGRSLAIGLLHLVQAVAASAAHLRLWVVTRGAQAVEPGELVHPEQAPLWGMHRGLMLEAPELRIACIDTGSDPAADAGSVMAELDAAPGEAQVAYRAGERFVVRLVRCPEAVPPTIDGPFRLQLKEYGSPDNLQLTPMTRQKPGRNRVEIAIVATALNFRDVVIALGMLKDFYANEIHGDMDLDALDLLSAVDASVETARRRAAGSAVDNHGALGQPRPRPRWTLRSGRHLLGGTPSLACSLAQGSAGVSPWNGCGGG
jgi:acyl transferase domain-containing protein